MASDTPKRHFTKDENMFMWYADIRLQGATEGQSHLLRLVSFVTQ